MLKYLKISLLGSAFLASMGGAVLANGEVPKPFGASIFQSSPISENTAITDPTREIGYGDRLFLRVWGAREFANSVMVDAEGNIFISQVGPVEVLGLNMSEAQAAIKQAFSKVYKDNVSVHATMADVNPVSVYVAGNVVRPGRYQGSRSDTVLDYLVMSGGIYAGSGSYREVSIKRENEAIETYDLYDFILRGEMRPFKFQNNDIVVVGYRNTSVVVESGAANIASFEFGKGIVYGQNLINLARVEPGVSHAMITRKGSGKNKDIYLKLDDFRRAQLQDGDRVSFRRDVGDDTVEVAIRGEVDGQKQFSIKKGASLKQLLSFISVDQSLVDIDAIHIERPSVAAEQRAALQQSLMRLQRSTIDQSSSSTMAAQVRAAEADMITSFVKSAEAIEFSGKVVLSREGEVSDVILQDGDVIVIPRKSDTVVVNGEVLITNAFLFEDGMRVKDYVAMSGGLSHRADPEQFVITHLDGSSDIVGPDQQVRNGDQIIAMPKVDEKGLLLTQQLVGIAYQVAVGAGAILGI